MSSCPKRIATFLMAFLMLFTVGCASQGDVDNYEVTEALMGDIDIEQLSSNRFTQLEPDGTKPLPNYPLEGYELACENDALALYLNEEYASIRVLNKATGYVWGALENEDPENLNNTWGSFAQSIVSISYIDQTGALKQIGAGHKDAKCKYKIKKDSILCSVDFGRKIDIKLEAKITLYEDRISFSLEDSSIEETGEYFVSAVYFVPFFGSTQGDQADGYLFVPDGSGALLRYRRPSKFLKPFASRVFGIDHAIDSLSEINDLDSNRPIDFLKPENTVTMPVFGLTHGVNNQAVFGYVKQGKPYAYINATPAGISTDYNWTTAYFVYRQVYSQPTSKNGAGVPVVQKNANTVNPVMDIYFLSGEKANYSGMAKTYASILKEEGALKNNMSEDAPNIALDFIAADIEKGLLSNRTTDVTGLEYIEESVKALQDKGIANISLAIQGWQKGGLNGYQKSEIYKSTVYGGFDLLSSLQSLLKDKQGSLLLYSDPLRARSVQINSRRDAGITLSQSTITKPAVDNRKFLGDLWYVKAEPAMEFLTRQSELIAEQGLGVSLDGGNLLYGEYIIDNFTSRQEVLDMLSSTVKGIAGDKGMTLYNPNEYLLSYTSVYRNAPVSGNQELYETDSVPFLQLVLSGNMTLVAPYANESFYSKIDLLKCIEYNVHPSFILTEEKNINLSKTTLADRSSTRFTDWKATIEATYSYINDLLDKVEGKEMLSHKRLNQLVFKITYENGTIYVNYGEEAFTEGTVTVDGESAVFVSQ